MPSSKTHHRNDSSGSSDGIFDYFPKLTEDDFKKIDEAVATAYGTPNKPFPSEAEIDGINLNLHAEEDWKKPEDNLPDIEQSTFGDKNGQLERSFASEIDVLNLGTLPEEELDAFVTERYSLAAGPSIPIVHEQSPAELSAGPTEPMKSLRSPLRQFRRQGVLSATDLSHPTWCEVQFDYGLRGKRSRPIDKRPAAFESASGKKISVEQKVAQKNDIRTKQGLAIHKEFQREIRAKELEVDVTTKETQWALRIVNTMVGLKELLHGPRNLTREMPVFGILHDRVVVGIIDELVCEPSIDYSSRKRKATEETSNGRPKKRLSSLDVDPDGLIESNEARPDSDGPNSVHTLHLRDAKTRKRHSIPDDRDALAGRLQLHIYFTLLEHLLTREPPFDFGLLWKKLDVNPDAKLPTKFLVQAQLISNNEDLGAISLNDLVVSFYNLIGDERMRVSPILELVYYLRPSEMWKGKGVERDVAEKESLDLLRAIAASYDSERVPTGNGTFSNEAGTSRRPDTAQSEHHLEEIVAALSQCDDINEEKGIRRFPLIGKKTFVYNKQEMDIHVSRLLEWWHGDRPPEGVPIHLTSRCRTCEYANDCEWREAKASELRRTSRIATRLKTPDT